MLRYSIKKYFRILRSIEIVTGRIPFLLALGLTAMGFLLTGRLADPSRAYVGETVVRKNGTLFLINRQTSFLSYFSLDITEPRTFCLMKSAKGEIFIDVGAHAGGYSVTFAKNFARVIAVEPNPYASSVLSRNCQLNHVDNIELISSALSDRRGDGTLHIPIGSSAMSSLVPNWKYHEGKSISKVSVHLATLDAICADIDGVISLVKIDVEGLEEQVLNGSLKTLPRIQRLIIEVSDESSARVSSLIDSYGLKVIQLDAGEGGGGNLLGTR
jgi:FkbM family methyltransferase